MIAPFDLLYTLLIAPFEHGFMLRALWVGCFAALACALLSCFIVTKGWALIGDAVSHAVLPGIVLAYLSALPMIVGALLSGLACVLMAGAIGARSRVKQDAVLGICFTGFLALGLVLMAMVPSNVHFTHVLLGNLLGIPADTRMQLLISGGLALLVLALRFQDLKLYCFDPAQARAIGLNVTLLHGLLLGTLALTTVAALQAVGLVQVIAMLVTPGCIGFLLARRFGWMLLWAVIAAMLSVWWGLAAGFAANIAPGGCIVLIQFGLFLLALALGPRRRTRFGRLGRSWATMVPGRRARASARISTRD